MLILNLSPEAEELLAKMARETGRAPEDIARRALLDFMEDYEDAKLADARHHDSDGTSFTLEEVMAKYPAVAPTEK